MILSYLDNHAIVYKICLDHSESMSNCPMQCGVMSQLVYNIISVLQIRRLRSRKGKIHCSVN